MAHHIEIHDIRVFKAVCDENGFGKAADRLFVTQSAVSQTIANLERKLDTVLLERNPLKLTETGIRLLNYAEAVLAEEDTLRADIRNINNGILSTLLLAISSTVNSLYGAELLGKYCEGFPLTRIKLNVMPSRQIIHAISSDLWELGFGPFQQTMPGTVHTIPLFEDERCLMISRGHPDYERIRNEGEAGLRDIPLIVSHLDDPDMRPAIEKLRDNFGTIWEINDLNLRINLVSRGLGMTYLDSRIASSFEACENFTALDLVSFAKIPLTFGIFHRKKKPLSTGAQQLIETARSIRF